MIEASSSIKPINEKFNRNNLFLTTESSELIVEQNPEKVDDFIEYLLENNVIFVLKDHVEAFFYPQMEEENPLEYQKEKLPLDNFVNAVRPDIEHDFRIIKDFAPKALSEGNCKNFVDLFQNRYQKLSRLFKAKPSMRDFQTISMVKKMKIKDTIKTVGMVSEFGITRNGHVIFTLEDNTGAIKALIHNRNEKLMEIGRMLVNDEVVGVTGTLGRDIVFVNHLEFPHIPVGRELNRSSEDICVAITSDLHVGSKNFLEASFLRFVRWLNLKYSGRVELASKIQYVVVVGDLVDGVGVYPGQEKDLALLDIREQYKKLADLLKLIPSHITVILLPGNHDATRIGEPQIPVLEDFAPDVYALENVEMVGNPCFLELHSVKLLLYHGGSLFDFLAKQTQHDDATLPMIEMLKKRHLSPIYGNTPVIPLEEDFLVIEDVPDVLATGHIHVNSHGNFRGTTVLNAGCWMSRTEYQKMRNINPTPSRVPIFNLKTHNTTVMNFGT
jgi:DNA polymerase II small subunit